MRVCFKTTIALVLVSVLAVLWPTTVGAATTTRAVKVKMVDSAFKPATLNASVGERVTFIFTNRGKIDHDAFIGRAEAQAKHEREMRAAEGDHHGGHGDEATNAVTVEPGKQARLTYTFKKAGTLEIGCHEAGHYDDGMMITVMVT